eukprot:s4758_g2.t1
MDTLLSCSDGADAGDEEDESETGFRVCSVSSDVPALLRSLYEARNFSGEVSFLFLINLFTMQHKVVAFKDPGD